MSNLFGCGCGKICTCSGGKKGKGLNPFKNKPLFKSNKEALSHYISQARELADKYGIPAYALFDIAENSPNWDDDLKLARALQRRIATLQELIKDENNKRTRR